MATSFGYRGLPSAHGARAQMNFWLGLALGLSIWVVLVGALLLA